MGGVFLNDYGVSALEAYDMNVIRTYRGRGALIVETDQGLRILKEYSGNPLRLENLNRILTHIRENGLKNCDMLVRNKEESFVTQGKERINYVLKEWFQGEECSSRSLEDIEKASKMLATLHISMTHMNVEEDTSVKTLYEQCRNHTNELRRTRDFIRKRSRKEEFEIEYLKQADCYLEKAESVCGILKSLDNHGLYQDVKEKKIYCHGDYNQHNILIQNNQINIINFEHCINDTRVRDLENFCRKISEKNDWDVHYGEIVINSYQSVSPLSEDEWKNLYYRLMYPEKFWKISNNYYNHSKAFISGKSQEKLDAFVKNEKQKEIFLKELFQM